MMMIVNIYRYNIQEGFGYIQAREQGEAYAIENTDWDRDCEHMEEELTQSICSRCKDTLSSLLSCTFHSDHYVTWKMR
jgi:hypothetical protein